MLAIRGSFDGPGSATRCGMRRRPRADLAVAVLATFVVAAVVRGAIDVSPPEGAGRPPASLITRPPTSADSRAATTTKARTPAPRAPTVLFVGETPDLQPRGGMARSFACRAAKTLHWQCAVLARRPVKDGRGTAGRATPTSAVTAEATGRPSAEYVVVTTAADDTAPEIRAVLDGLPGSPRRATVVVLGPIVASPSPRIARLIAAERTLAAEHHATFIDPVAEQWITPVSRARYLNREQLSSLGIPVAARRLATDLGRLARPGTGR
jgi:hypothetical protein